MSSIEELMRNIPEREAPLTSQWRVCPADSSVPTMSASAMTTVYFEEVRSVIELLAGVIVMPGAFATSAYARQ